MSNIFIISGPSGAGEDSVIEGLKQIFDTENIITTTTREPREGEHEGIPYYFIDKKSFKKMINEGKFSEYACQYNNNYYGVTHRELRRAKKTDKIVFWKIEYKGVMTANKKYPEIKSIYIAPPSLEIIRKRILKRNPEANEKYLQERLSYTKEWLKHEDIYDYKIVNEEGELSKTIEKVAKIIKDNLKNKNAESNSEKISK